MEIDRATELLMTLLSELGYRDEANTPGMKAAFQLWEIALEAETQRERARELESISGKRLSRAEITNRCFLAARVILDHFPNADLGEGPPRGFWKRLATSSERTYRGMSDTAWKNFFDADPARWKKALFLVGCMEQSQ